MVPGVKRSTASVAALAAIFGVAGVTHLLKPGPYVRIVPGWVPAADALVFWSGIAELALAGGLAHPRTRRATALSAIVFLLAVFPANIKHAFDAPSGTTEWWLTRVRLPIQPLLIWWAARIAAAPEREASPPA
jgi:uncharacterized membrane protein